MRPRELLPCERRNRALPANCPKCGARRYEVCAIRAGYAAQVLEDARRVAEPFAKGWPTDRIATPQECDQTVPVRRGDMIALAEAFRVLEPGFPAPDTRGEG